MDAPEEETIHTAAGQVYRAVCPASLAAIPRVRAAFIAFLEDINAPDALLAGWKLVFTELANNAVIHGAGNNEEYVIRIDWELRDRAVVLGITDPGDGPPTGHYENAELPDDPFQTHGRGAYLVRSFADTVTEWRGTFGFRVEVLRLIHDHSMIAPPSPEMERVIAELSACYEGLAAFYELGSSLAKSDSLRAFLEGSIGNLAMSQTFDLIRIYGAPTLPAFAEAELSSIDSVYLDADTPEAVRRVVGKKVELIWETTTQRKSLGIDVSDFETYRSGCILPINSGIHYFGALTAARGRNNDRITSSEVSTLRTFADIIGIAMANFVSSTERRNAEKDLREFEIAADIQHHLLPVSFRATEQENTPQIFQTEALNVAGDFAEYRASADGYHYVTIIDVMGKGVSAALLGIIYRTAFNLMIGHGQSLPALMHAINEVLIRMLGKLTMFVTVTILRWKDSLAEVEHINAGHCPTLCLRADGALDEFGPSGPPIGLVPGYAYRVDIIPLSPGDRLILVTDGCYEWKTGDAIFGWEAFCDLVRNTAADTGSILWKRITDEISAHDALDPPQDDITIVFLKHTHE